MKKVRFENCADCDEMDNLDCHSPRPHVGIHLPERTKNLLECDKNLGKFDPIELYERSNSYPYSESCKTTLSNSYENSARFHPSNELDLSMLDIGQEPIKYPFCKPTPFKPPVFNNYYGISHGNTQSSGPSTVNVSPVLKPMENLKKLQVRPVKENSFFIRRDNIHTMQQSTNYFRKQFQQTHFGKENALTSKVDIMMNGITNPFSTIKNESEDALTPSDEGSCNCDHCRRQIDNMSQHLCHPIKVIPHNCDNCQTYNGGSEQCHCSITCHLHYGQKFNSTCNAGHNANNANKANCCQQNMNTPPNLQNAVLKKTLAVENIEQKKNSECTAVEKPSVIVKEKREPTVADLFKIIKLQNEQLQLLQEKVDKFISSNVNKPEPQLLPVHNYVTEHVALETVDNNHKISIGVMTSFEIHTSTVTNRDLMKQTNKNTEVQCNRAHIKDFCQPASQNILDGIQPIGSTSPSEVQDKICSNKTLHCNTPQNAPHMPEEKTLNECSLYNIQVDNATTPLISPEQTMYLDVRDYSDSDSSSSDQSNVGWTYYNKVMTHVNNVLHDSDMPSSASALFRKTRQQCVQMHIDKTNISVAKRVKFGDEYQSSPQQSQYRQHLKHAASTDTSMKMNLLAAKYLKKPTEPQHPDVNVAAPAEMSFATRKYMQRHHILQGVATQSRSPLENIAYGKGLGSPTYEMPKFLDITALKQQPKLL